MRWVRPYLLVCLVVCGLQLRLQIADGGYGCVDWQLGRPPQLACCWQLHLRFQVVPLVASAVSVGSCRVQHRGCHVHCCWLVFLSLQSAWVIRGASNKWGTPAVLTLHMYVQLLLLASTHIHAQTRAQVVRTHTVCLHISMRSSSCWHGCLHSWSTRPDPVEFVCHSACDPFYIVVTLHPCTNRTL